MTYQYFKPCIKPEHARKQFISLLGAHTDPGEVAAISREYQEILIELETRGTTETWNDKETKFKNDESESKLANIARQTVEALRDTSATIEAIGKWLWVSFDDKPHESTRSALKSLGYRWNRTRECWQWSAHKKRTFASRSGKQWLERKYGKEEIRA